MKKHSILVIIGFMLTGITYGQDYKLATNKNSLKIIEVNNAIIEGYAGKEIIFSSNSSSREGDERAKGLRAISSIGLEDNTGLGLSVIEVDGTVQVQQLKKMDGPNVTIKVPQGMAVKYLHSSPFGSDLEIKNLTGDLDVSTVHNDVNLENVTGAIHVKTVHGDIEAFFTGSISKTISLSSTHGHVDVSLPTSTKANLKLDTSWGEIFVDPDFKFYLDKTGDLVRYNDKLTAKINGGGTDISLSSTHDNVYLRRK